VLLTGAHETDRHRLRGPRHPLSEQFDGSDAMNPDPDYSAVYLVLRADDPVEAEGHGFCFTIGRGNDVTAAPSGRCSPTSVVGRPAPCAGDAKLVRLAKQAVADGFEQVKPKVGADLDDDVRRMRLARDAVGPGVRIAVYANQRWDVSEELRWMKALAPFEKEAGIDPAPDRASTTWADFLCSQADAVLACDFFETVTVTGVRMTCSQQSSTSTGGSGSWVPPRTPLPRGWLRLRRTC
jgi:L-alanine-DL-glutamate epimerase-like enolase superfamily enzyme